MAGYQPATRMVDDRDEKHGTTWWESGERYVAGGRVMATEYKPEWDDELEEMNWARWAARSGILTP